MADMQTMCAKRLPPSFSGCLLALLLLAGCATRPQAPQATPATTAPAATITTPAPRPEPDAVFNLDSGNRPLPRQVNSTLEKIAAQIKANRDLVIRLESFTPSGGSREMNVSLSTSAVERIRRRLVELGVPSYRISLAPLGEEHPEARRLDSKRVELFIVPLPR